MKLATRLMPTVAAKKVIAATTVRVTLSMRATMSVGLVSVSEYDHGAGGDHQRDHRENRQAHRQAEEITDAHLPLIFHEAGEIAVIDYHTAAK